MFSRILTDPSITKSLLIKQIYDVLKKSILLSFLYHWFLIPYRAYKFFREGRIFVKERCPSVKIPGAASRSLVDVGV